MTNRPPQRRRLGPGLLVAAAFIGPGTVTVATRAGARFGFDLLWTLLVAVAATIVLQEMAARLGIVARRGLAEAIRESIGPAWARGAASALVVTAIVLGNTAYQTGNLMGAGVGLSILTGLPAWAGAALIGVAVIALLLFAAGTQAASRVLIPMVLAMSAAFVATAFCVGADPRLVARGVVAFTLPEGATLSALALLGTTVVPYNLFLHAAAVQQRWAANDPVTDALRAARADTVIAVAGGGLVTMAIVVTAAAAFSDQPDPPGAAADAARQLEPVLGSTGRVLFAAGLAAAGLTSAITAPLAAGYAAAGAFGATGSRVANRTAVGVAAVGVALACLLGRSPQPTIVVAQAANGLLLPLVAVFLLVVMNRRDLLGEHRNDWRTNSAGVAVVLVAMGLGGKSLLSLFD